MKCLLSHVIGEGGKDNIYQWCMHWFILLMAAAREGGWHNSSPAERSESHTQWNKNKLSTSRYRHIHCISRFPKLLPTVTTLSREVERNFPWRRGTPAPSLFSLAQKRNIKFLVCFFSVFFCAPSSKRHVVFFLNTCPVHLHQLSLSGWEHWESQIQKKSENKLIKKNTCDLLAVGLLGCWANLCRTPSVIF